MRLPGRGGAPADWLLVGLGNPGAEYERTRHNIGFEIARTLIARWELPKPKSRYRGLLSEGRTGPGGPRVAVLMPQTFMNDAGHVGRPRARGAEGAARPRARAPRRDRPAVRRDPRPPRAAGWRATTGSNRSSRGSARPTSCASARASGGPPTTDPDRVAAYVLGRFREPAGRRAGAGRRRGRRRRARDRRWSAWGLMPACRESDAGS